ncbi:FMN-binding domain-containing protein [Brevinema andersonii]|uniref:FMN-binding domain-containing protein n=1 Tax=Brevinema andersonii TaxID=34097 RepID=A0A1I1EWL6_BREAD|nr:FMN-binding protein [Brevinema andersonii]SFB89303.1 FMN-binding domain-containing protein [Brevinema andersonii]
MSEKNIVIGSPKFHLQNVLSLTLITGLMTFSLLFVYYFTYQEPNPLLDIQEMLGKKAQEYNIIQEEMDLDGEPNIYWSVVSTNEQEIMRVFRVSSGGFGGPVVALVGTDGQQVLAIKVLDASSETAGLGQKVTEQGFQRQFLGLKIDQLPIDRTDWGSKNLDMISGATFSSSALVKDINEAFVMYDLSKKAEGEVS